MIDTLIAQVDGLTLIVEDLRTIGLFNARRLRLNLADTDLAVVVKSGLAMVSVELEDAGMPVVLKLSTTRVRADDDRVRQALVALLTNAIRYAPGGRLLIEVFPQGAEGVLRCTDSGPGLPSGAADFVFEPFWRADESRGRSNGGSGLGLAVVKAIAEAHGGSVAARSEGGGATFELRLPRS